MKTTTITILSILLFASCQINRRSMRESNYQVWLNKTDLNYTAHKTGTASQTKVLGVDWQRLFGRKYDMGGIGNLPLDPLSGSPSTQLSTISMGTSETFPDPLFSLTSVIGLSSGIDRVQQFAISDLIAKNPGYDLIMFPQFEVQRKWFVFGSKTTVNVKARMAKITPEQL